MCLGEAPVHCNTGGQESGQDGGQDGGQDSGQDSGQAKQSGQRCHAQHMSEAENDKTFKYGPQIG